MTADPWCRRVAHLRHRRLASGQLASGSAVAHTHVKLSSPACDGGRPARGERTHDKTEGWCMKPIHGGLSVRCGVIALLVGLSLARWGAPAARAAAAAPQPSSDDVVYLSDLEPTEIKVFHDKNWNFGTKGKVGERDGRKIEVNGQPSPHGL